MTQEIWKSWYCLKQHIFLLTSSHLLITSKLSSVSLQAAANPSTSTRKSESVRGAWSGDYWLLWIRSDETNWDGWVVAHIGFYSIHFCIESIQKWMRFGDDWWIGFFYTEGNPRQNFWSNRDKTNPSVATPATAKWFCSGCIEIDEDVTVEIHFGRSRGKIGQNVQYPSKCSTKGIFGRTRRTKDIFQDSETDLWCSWGVEHICFCVNYPPPSALTIMILNYNDQFWSSIFPISNTSKLSTSFHLVGSCRVDDQLLHKAPQLFRLPAKMSPMLLFPTSSL